MEVGDWSNAGPNSGLFSVHPAVTSEYVWNLFGSRLSKNQVLHTNYFSDYHTREKGDVGVINTGGYYKDFLLNPSGWPANIYGLFLNVHWAYNREGGEWSGSRLSLFSALTTFSDYHRQGNDSKLFVGASWSDGDAYGANVCGVFSIEITSTGTNFDYSSRLSKIPQIFALTKDYHDNSGDGGSSFWPVYGNRGGNMTDCGIFCDNDVSKTELNPKFCSRLSKNQVEVS